MNPRVSLIALIALTACETTYPDIALDEASMKPAKVVSFDDKKPVREIIETATD